MLNLDPEFVDKEKNDIQPTYNQVVDNEDLLDAIKSENRAPRVNSVVDHRKSDLGTNLKESGGEESYDSNKDFKISEQHKSKDNNSHVKSKIDHKSLEEKARHDNFLPESEYQEGDISVEVNFEKYTKTRSQPHTRCHAIIHNLTNDNVTNIKISYRTNTDDIKLMVNQSQRSTGILPQSSITVEILIQFIRPTLEIPKVSLEYEIQQKGGKETMNYNFQIQYNILDLIMFVDTPRSKLSEKAPTWPSVTREIFFYPGLLEENQDSQLLIKKLKFLAKEESQMIYQGFFRYLVLQNAVYQLTLTCDHTRNTTIINLRLVEDKEPQTGGNGLQTLIQGLVLLFGVQ